MLLSTVVTGKPLFHPGRDRLTGHAHFMSPAYPDHDSKKYTINLTKIPVGILRRRGLRDQTRSFRELASCM
jgi:hypothetical protein